MTEKEFTQARKDLLKSLEYFKQKINLEFTEITRLFNEENCPVKLHNVYEIKGKPPRGCQNRFVVYSIDNSFWKDNTHVLTTAGGWWLDKYNTPKKWTNETVLGVSNPSIFELSSNQEHNKHPDSNE